MLRTQTATQKTCEYGIQKVALYKMMAATVIALNNCRQYADTEWEPRHMEKLEKLLDSLPHGSGIDGKWEVILDQSNSDKIVLRQSYHVMNENGFYTGWIDFTVIVKPDFISGFKLSIKGKFSDYRWQGESIKEYLYEILDFGLRELV